MSEPGWHSELQFIVNKVGQREASRLLGVPSGTISTWLNIPRLQSRLERIRSLLFPTIVDLREAQVISQQLRFRPGETSQEIIHIIYESLQTIPEIPIIVEQYRFVRFAWYIDLYNNLTQKYELHVRITLSGTVRQSLLDRNPDMVKEFLKKQLREATNTTTVYAPRVGNGIDDTLFLFFRRMEGQGIYGDIETSNVALQYDPNWQYYSYFRNDKRDGKRYEYIWSFNWTIEESRWP